MFGTEHAFQLFRNGRHSALLQAERVRDSGKYEGGIIYFRQRNKADAIREGSIQRRGNLDTQARFADSSRAKQGNEAHIGPFEQSAHSPHIPLAFEYFGSRAPRLNPAWLDALSKSANSPGGLSIVPEPEAPEAP